MTFNERVAEWKKGDADRTPNWSTEESSLVMTAICKKIWKDFKTKEKTNVA